MERSLKELRDVLGVSPGATPQQVKEAYRDLVQFWHPDKHSDKVPRLRQLAEEKMKDLNDAYESLKNGVPSEEYQSQQFPNESGANYGNSPPPILGSTFSVKINFG